MTRILIVDDLEQNRYLLEATLRGYGYEVTSAHDGAEALATARRLPPDLVISDILMPVMDGFTLCQQWRADERLRAIPFIFFTATYTDPKDEQLALDLGADRFVLKPQEPQVMNEIVRAVLAGSAKTAVPGAPEPLPEEIVTLREYNGALVRKLNKKLNELEAAHQQLLADVRQRQEAEEALRQSEERWRLIYETEPECVKVIAPDGRLRDMNPAGLAMIDAESLEQVRGQPLVALVTAEHKEAYQEMHRQVINGQRGYLVFEVTGLKGTRRCLETREAPLRDAAGQITGALGITLDITERKRAEAERTRLARQVELLLQSTIEGIYGIDLEGRCTFINRAGAAMIGCRPDEVLGRNMHEVMHHHRPDGPADPVEDCPIFRAFETTHGCRVDTDVFWRRDGSSFPVEYSSSPIMEDGVIAGAVVTYSDTTERRRLEAQFRQSQKMEAIGQLAGGVAHDFNNILAVMMMQAELTGMADGLPEEVREGLRQIRAAAERAANLTRQLLLFSRKQVMQPRELDVNDVVISLADMLHRIIGDDVRLQLNLHPRPLITRADAGMLDQVLMNLAVNARDAMPGGGWIVIETTEQTITEEEAALILDAKPGRHVRLRVTDTGCGIAPKHLSRIFEPFFTTKEPGEGTGLGLATVFGIVEQHGGSLAVESEVGRGTTVQICLPATEVADVASTKEASKPKPRRGTETILLVEDEPFVRMLTRIVLERWGYQVLEAAHGVEALRIWEQHAGPIHLLLTDIVMPEGIGGRELAARLLERSPQLRVIFTSGYSADIAGGQLILREGHNFLQKPCPPDQILEAVRRRLDG